MVRSLRCRGLLLLPIAVLATLPALSITHKRATSSRSDRPVDRKSGANAASPGKQERTVYDYNLPGADGKDIPVSSFRGKFLLIVNLARASSYSSQLPALIQLSKSYKDRGLVVVGIPSNDFGASEPGTDAEIHKFYADAKAEFLVADVAKVSGDEAIPLYLYLTHPSDAAAADAVHWNYTKFFVDRKGKVIARLDPDVAPDSPEMTATIEQILTDRYKPTNEPAKATLNVAAGPAN
ncbi:MAG: glutathione peroxidase [Acidobacteriaceae bacterium]|jgi:glutathione peroxidase|nr:glutathione peroxidase [Acidobacteriaceae bacterium]